MSDYTLNLLKILITKATRYIPNKPINNSHIIANHQYIGKGSISLRNK
jgi:hypothetical protein